MSESSLEPMCNIHFCPQEMAWFLRDDEFTDAVVRIDRATVTSCLAPERR